MKDLKLKIRISTREIMESSRRVINEQVIINKDDIIDEIDGIQIIHCNDIVWGTSARIACSGKIGYIFDCIYVDDFYFMLPKFVREFILYHELGHIRNNHNDNILDIRSHNLRRLFKIDLMEIEADRYALEKLGKDKSVDALTYLFESVDLNYLCKKELKKRLKEIKVL